MNFWQGFLYLLHFSQRHTVSEVCSECGNNADHTWTPLVMYLTSKYRVPLLELKRITSSLRY